MKLLACILLYISCVFSAFTFAADYTWDGGGTDNNWDTPQNWTADSGFPDGNTDTAAFTGSARPDISLNGDKTVFSVTIDAAAAAPFAISNDTLTIADGGSITWDENATANNQQIFSDITCAGNASLVNNNAWIHNADQLIVRGKISCAGTLTIEGLGTGGIKLTANNASSFTGPVVLNSGMLLVGNNTALGTTLAGTTINGGELWFDAGVACPEHFVIAGNCTWNSLSANGPHSGTITVNTGVTWTIGNGGGNPMNLNGAVAGDGEIIMTGGATRFSGSENNTFSGTITFSSWRDWWEGGYSIYLAKSGGATAIYGDLKLGQYASAKYEADNQIWYGSSVTLDGENGGNNDLYASLNLNGFSDIITGLTITNSSYVDTGSNGTLTVENVMVDGVEIADGTYDSSEPWIRGGGEVIVTAVTIPYAPTGVSASDGEFSDKVVITWDAMTDADRYTVYRSTGVNPADAEDISGEISAATFNDTTALVGQSYNYWVKARYGTLWSPFSESDSGYRATGTSIDPPQNVQATDGTYEDRIVVSWSPVSNATRYMVFRNTENDSGAATDISGEITGTQYNDDSVTAGQTYYYWVKAGDASGWSLFSDPDTGITKMPLIAYDGFDYPAGETLNTKNGGIGWNGSWSEIGDGTVLIESPGLTYDIVTTEGNRLYLAPTNAYSSRSIRVLPETLGDDESTVWFSCIMQQVNEPGGPDFSVTLSSGLSVGRGWGVMHWGLGNAWGENQQSTVPVSSQAFMLVRIDFGSSSDTAYLWVNPSLKGEPDPATADVVKVAPEGKRIVISQVQANGYEGMEGIVDEIRLGNTFWEVTPTKAAIKVSASDGTYEDKIRITWEGKSSATAFSVYRATEDDINSASDITGELAPTNMYDDTTASAGTVYYYWVRTKYSDGWAPFSYSDPGLRKVSGAPEPPGNVAATDGTEADFVRITWDASSGATKYMVYRNTVNDELSSEDISGEITATAYDDAAAGPGRQYYYWVKAGNVSGWSYFSESDTGFRSAELIAYYALNELDGTNATDSSNHEFDGVYVDNPVLGIQSVNPELYNTAVGFNPGGGFGHVIIASNSPIRELTNNFSVALWVKPEDIVLPGDQVFIGTPQIGIGWIVSTVEGRLKFTTWSVQDYMSSAFVISNDTWTHIAVTMTDANDVQFYVDGDPLENLKIGNAPANYGLIETYLGTDGNDAYPYFGVLDEVRVYNGILTQDEIRDLAYVPEPALFSLFIILGFCMVRKMPRNG
jgi:fibronectin type 3 domain-containing protein